MTPYQMLTVASIVEKEGYIPVNMPDTARVIYNRLAQGHPAADGLDGAVRAGAGRGTGDRAGPQDPVPVQLVPEHRADADAHLHALEDALNAAVHPPAGAWLYFVLVKKDGTMAFSDTYAEQLANEQLAKSRGLP